MNKKIDVLLIYPWGNMRDYFEWLNNSLSLSNTIFKPSFSLLDLIRHLSQVDMKKVDDGISFQLMRKKGKIERKRKVGTFRLNIQKLFYRIKYMGIFARSYHYFKHCKPDLIAIWNGHRLAERAVIDAAERFNLNIAYFENGFIPKTTLIDPKGVNIDCSLIRDPSFYHSYVSKRGGISKLNKIDSQLEVRETHEKKFKNSIQDSDDLTSPFIFVPFQVDIDSQVLVNSPRIQSMYTLYDEIKSLAERNPSWRFVIKEHPSCVSKYNELYNATSNIEFTTTNTETLIRHADCIVTLNSSVGIEALLQFKKVILLGEAAYGIEGITQFAKNLDDLEQLIQGALDKNWEPDKALTHGFLDFLKNDFLVAGGWRQRGDNHLKSVEDRFIELINQKK